MQGDPAMRTVTNEDAVILETLDRMKEVPCCERTESGCFHRHGDCCCSCDHCLCAYVALQVEQGDAVVSRYLPKLGYAVIVEISETPDIVEGGEVVALIAPGKVWFPENATGWIPMADPGPGPQAALLTA
jgi:hypothetical protein